MRATKRCKDMFRRRGGGAVDVLVDYVYNCSPRPVCKRSALVKAGLDPGSWIRRRLRLILTMLGR